MLFKGLALKLIELSMWGRNHEENGGRDIIRNSRGYYLLNICITAFLAVVIKSLTRCNLKEEGFTLTQV